MNKNIKILIEETVKKVLLEKEIKNTKLAKEYVYSIKKKNPELYKKLKKEAEFVISAVKNGYTPKEKLKAVNIFLNNNNDLDPRDSADTHGLRLVLDYIISKKNIKEPGRFAGRTKRWYHSALDQLLKATYGNQPIRAYTPEGKTYAAGTLRESVTKKPFIMDLPVDLLKISNIFFQNDFQLYVVGGAVRDAILGQHPKDYDLATNAKPHQVLEIFSNKPGYRTIEIGKAFGVINVYSKENNEYEIATFRKDLSAGRRPDAIEFTTIENDVNRRDITMNALFYDIQNKEIVDFVGGIKDLNNKVVKAVGNAERRFDEDRLRILRAVRFASRFGTELEPETESAILHNSSLHGVSSERIREEFIKSIKSAKSVVSLFRMYEGYNLWKEIFPGLKINEKYVETKNLPVLLALLLRENSPKTLGKILNKLSYNVIEIKQVVFLVMFQGLSLNNAYQYKKLFLSTRLNNNDLLNFGNNVPMNMKLVIAFTKYDLSIKGKDLLDKGLKGRDLGREMERLENLVFMDLV